MRGVTSFDISRNSFPSCDWERTWTQSFTLQASACVRRPHFAEFLEAQLLKQSRSQVQLGNEKGRGFEREGDEAPQISPIGPIGPICPILPPIPDPILTVDDRAWGDDERDTAS